MSPPNRPDTARPNRTDGARPVRRRRFLALGAGATTALLAGCTGDPGLGADGGTSPTGAEARTGTFRLLISDQPVAIGDFDELTVTFDRARVFRGEGEEASPEPTGTETATPDTATAITTTMANATATDTSTATANATTATAAEPDEGDQRGFSVIDLEGATVDLTEVVGDKAIGVFEGELEAGRYTKIELYAADVEGIVGGEPVEVKIPSGKLQIVKPFEVVPGEELTFVFDINVVKKGGTGEYNLLPVISESGVAGEEVAVNEVGESADGEDEETEIEETEEPETEDEETENEEPGEDDGEDGGPPSDAGEGQP